MRMQLRVKRGRRRIYERKRCGLKEGMEIGAMAQSWAFEGFAQDRLVGLEKLYIIMLYS
jgi:hypothetical protein